MLSNDDSRRINSKHTLFPVKRNRMVLPFTDIPTSPLSPFCVLKGTKTFFEKWMNFIQIAHQYWHKTSNRQNWSEVTMIYYFAVKNYKTWHNKGHLHKKYFSENFFFTQALAQIHWIGTPPNRGSIDMFTSKLPCLGSISHQDLQRSARTGQISFQQKWHKQQVTSCPVPAEKATVAIQIKKPHVQSAHIYIWAEQKSQHWPHERYCPWMMHWRGGGGEEEQYNDGVANAWGQ